MSDRDNDREAARLDGNYMAIRYIDRLSALEAENERLRVDAERLRKHLHAPDRCPVCRWTNINLMNYGTTDESRWMCHSCAATALSDLARVRSENEKLRRDVASWEGCNFERQLDEARSDLARVREECELVREAMRQAQQTATRRLDECDRMRPSDEIFETGRWYACTGCHESDEGHPTGTYNAALRCHVGGGCFECGGIGARWEQFDEDALTPKEP
jgi:hypothetical protein